MPELSFKTTAYKRYSPWLFKLCKLKCRILFDLGKNNSEEFYGMMWDRYLAKKYLQEAWQIRGIPNEELKWQKRSNTLFILGCGSSINDVTAQQWQEISKFDSIGVNYFYFHDFVPTAHFIELGLSTEAEKAVHKLLLNNPLRKEKVFMQIRHLIRNNVQLQCSPDRVNLYSPTTMKSRNIASLKSYLERYYNSSSVKSPLIHHSSTLDCVINFAVRQGYKKICLVGVDLNNNSYFWDTGVPSENNQLAIEAVDADYRAANWVRESSVHHATVDKNLNDRLNCLDLLSYLSLLKETEFKRHGVDVAITNPQSLLTSLFPYQNISDAARANT